MKEMASALPADTMNDVGSLAVLSEEASNEDVQQWLLSFENGRLALPVLKDATGAELYRLKEGNFVDLLGLSLGPSLYAAIHPPQGTIH